MFRYTNVRKRKRKTGFLLILLCFLSSSLFAQNFIQDNKSKDITTDEELTTFDDEILGELKTSSYSQTFEGSGNNTNMALHQSYINNTFNTVVNTSVVNGNNFTVLCPQDANFNSSYAKFTVEDITAPNKTLTIENETGASKVILSNSHYAFSFRVLGDCYLDNFSIALSSSTVGGGITVDLYNASISTHEPESAIYSAIHSYASAVPASSPMFWYNVTNLDTFLDTSNTYNNTFYIDIRYFNPFGDDIDYHFEDESNGDDSRNWRYFSSTWWPLPNEDASLKVDLNPINNTAKPTEIGLKIDDKEVSDTDWGSGYLESYNVNGSDSGSYYYNVSADWWDVQCNITQVQINYTKDDLNATTQFTVTTSSSTVSWNVSRKITNFDANLFNSSSINFTVPESWNYTTYQVFNGSPSKEMTSYSYNRSIGGGFREICITNGSNGYWYILIDSINQIGSIGTFDLLDNTFQTFNYTNTIHFNTTLKINISQDNGLFNLSVYDLNSVLNYTKYNSTFNSGSEISLLNWTIAKTVSGDAYGVYPIQLTWLNGTEVGYGEKNITIVAQTDLEFIDLNQNTVYDASDLFNITVNFTDAGRGNNITNARIQYKINDKSISGVNDNVTYINYGLYNIEIDCNHSDFNPYGINNITIFANKTFHYNQSKVLYIVILAETNFTTDYYPFTTEFYSDQMFNITTNFTNYVRNKTFIDEYGITIKVNGSLYLDSIDNATQFDNLTSGKYNITLQCSDDIFADDGYGPFIIEVIVNKSYHYNQTYSFNINITGRAALTVSKYPNKTNYGSEDIFNITAYYNDTIRNEKINGAEITVDVDGIPYLSSIDNATRFDMIGNGTHYNITINCNDTIFKYYGQFVLTINASKQYYESQSNSSLDPIIIGNTTLNITTPLKSPIPQYKSDNVFNLTAYYHDVEQSKGITGANITVKVDGDFYINSTANASLITDLGNGNYNITINCSHNVFDYGHNEIQVIATQFNHTTGYDNITIDIIVVTKIIPIIPATMGANNVFSLDPIRRGEPTSVTFNYTDIDGNAINNATISFESSNRNFIDDYDENGNGNYTVTIDSSGVNVGSYTYIFSITAQGNETQVIRLQGIVNPATTEIQSLQLGTTPARHTGLNQSVTFTFTDLIESSGIGILTTANIIVYDNTGVNVTEWGRGPTDHNYTLVHLGGGDYRLDVSIYGLSVGWYNFSFTINPNSNYVGASSSQMRFYLRGYYSTFGLMSLSDEGGFLISNDTAYNYTSYIRNDLDIRFNLTYDDLGGVLVLDHMDSYSITYMDLNNTSITGTINNSIIFYSVNDTYGYFIGALNLTQANLTAGYYQFDIGITRTYFESVSFSFYLTILPRYSINVSVDSFLEDVRAGEDFWIAFNVSIILNSPTEPLEGALVTLTPIINGIPINPITETTNSTGIVVFEFTLPSNTQNLSLGLTLEGEFSYEGTLTSFSDFTVKPARSAGISFEVLLTYLVIFGITISAAGGSFAVYRGVVVPKKREKARILMEVKTIFDDAINLEHILILYKGTGTCVYFKSFGSEVIDPDLISGFISAICSFGKDLVMQEELNEVTYGEKMLLLSDGEFIRVALVLGKKASLILRENTMEFINIFEKTYAAELPNWRGQLDIFRSAGTIIDEILNTSIILPHELTYEFSNMKALKKPHSRDVLKIAEDLMKDSERNFFFIATLLKEASEKTSKDTAEIFMGIKELRDRRILKPIEISAIDVPPISQQEINLIDQRVSGLVNLSPEEKQKLINDLAQQGPAEREAYFSSITEQREIVTAPVETKPEAPLIDNIKKAKKEIQKLRKKALSAKKKKDYENSINSYQNAAKIATDWEFSKECQELEDIIRITKIEDIKIKMEILEKEAKVAEKAENYNEAAQKYKASSKTASEIFKLGVTDMTKEVKRLTNKSKECEKLI